MQAADTLSWHTANSSTQSSGQSCGAYNFKAVPLQLTER